jgi:uncharacterized protein YllA (UPF0747 family)
VAPRALSVTARALAVRARVGSQPGRGPSGDALTLDLLARGPVSRERVATSWRDAEGLKALAAAKRAPLPAELTRALTDLHRRLGASPASLAHLDRLARGEAVAAVAGQQPAPLGGPLFSLHKTAATVGLARTMTARTGVPCVPLFWMHGEDSDFAEIRSVTLVDAELQLHDFALPDSAHVDGGLVGSIGVDAVRALGEQALAAWQGLPGVGEARERWTRALERARDLGEAMCALWLALFAAEGLVVVDPRLPEFRAAARPILERYLARADELHAAARRAGERMEQLAGKRALNDAALESFVFELRDGRRAKRLPAEARGAGALSPSVALRPAVQDGVFPTVAMACGPGEIAYLVELREVFEGVGVRPAAPVPRFGATWLPPAAVELLEASGCDPWELVSHTDQVVTKVAEARVPESLRRTLAGSRASLERTLAELAEASRAYDASLPQMVESARGKMDFQLARVMEGVLGKARARLDREHPAWRRLRYVLWPGDKLQERRLASLEPVARLGASVIAALCDHATEHAARAADGIHDHWLLEA